MLDKMGTRLLRKHNAQREKFTEILKFIRFAKDPEDYKQTNLR